MHAWGFIQSLSEFKNKKKKLSEYLPWMDLLDRIGASPVFVRVSCEMGRRK